MLTLLALLSTTATAADIELMHTGRLLDSTGAAITGATNITIALYDSPSSGSVIWAENKSPVLDNGFFSVTLGDQIPLESEWFEGGPLYVGIAVNNGPELPERFKLHSVPSAVYALGAEKAFSVEGGTVDVSEIRINGQTVIGSDGTLSGSATTGGLASISCSDGQVLKWTSGAWACDEDSGLTDDQVRAIVTGGAVDLHANSTINGVAIATVDDLPTELAGVDCGSGKTLQGIDNSGAPVCADLPAYSGSDFATANQSCDASEVVLGVGTDGALQCGPARGAVQLANTSVCNSGAAGTLRYDDTNETLDVCDGDAWVTLKTFGSLYDFSSHTFTSCGVSGREGPTLSQCRGAYSTTWDSNDDYLTMATPGIQLWTVPTTGRYRIAAVGARGAQNSASYSGGQGARIQGDFDLTAGDVLQIAVGQVGVGNATHGNENGGGGGSFVVAQDGNTPLIVAGGGGGAPSFNYSGGCSRTNGDAQTGTSGKTVNCLGTGAGGSNGSGGQTNGGNQVGGAGGGMFSNGQDGRPHCNTPGGGQSFTNGAVGGLSRSCYSPPAHGGFGGGGAGELGAPGGGGGYSGGGASGQWSSYADYGGGGGSYNGGSNQSNQGGANNSDGQVSITFLD